jgi:hypothetical protein
LDRFQHSSESFLIIQKALCDADAAIIAAAAAAAAAVAEVDVLREVWFKKPPGDGRSQPASVPPENLLPSLAKLLTSAR